MRIFPRVSGEDLESSLFFYSFTPWPVARRRGCAQVLGSNPQSHPNRGITTLCRRCFLAVSIYIYEIQTVGLRWFVLLNCARERERERDVSVHSRNVKAKEKRWRKKKFLRVPVPDRAR